MEKLVKIDEIKCSLEAVKAYGLNFTWFRDIEDGGKMKYQAIHRNSIILVSQKTPSYKYDERHTWTVYDKFDIRDDRIARLKAKLESFDD